MKIPKRKLQSQIISNSPMFHSKLTHPDWKTSHEFFDIVFLKQDTKDYGSKYKSYIVNSILPEEHEKTGVRIISEATGGIREIKCEIIEIFDRAYEETKGMTMKQYLKKKYEKPETIDLLPNLILTNLKVFNKITMPGGCALSICKDCFLRGVISISSIFFRAKDGGNAKTHVRSHERSKLARLANGCSPTEPKAKLPKLPSPSLEESLLQEFSLNVAAMGSRQLQIGDDESKPNVKLEAENNVDEHVEEMVSKQQLDVLKMYYEEILNQKDIRIQELEKQNESLPAELLSVW